MFRKIMKGLTDYWKHVPLFISTRLNHKMAKRQFGHVVIQNVVYNVVQCAHVVYKKKKKKIDFEKIQHEKVLRGNPST